MDGSQTAKFVNIFFLKSFPLCGNMCMTPQYLQYVIYMYRTPKPDDYLSLLEEEPGFLNPSSSDNLKLVLGIRNSSGTAPLPPGTRPTLIKDFQKSTISVFCQSSPYIILLVAGKHFQSQTTAML